MLAISAQELKLGGLTKIKQMLGQAHDFIIQERGKDACVVVDLEYFNELKMCELEVAYLKTQADIKAGKYEVVNDVDVHVEQLLDEIDGTIKKVRNNKKDTGLK